MIFLHDVATSLIVKTKKLGMLFTARRFILSFPANLAFVVEACCDNSSSMRAYKLYGKC